MKLKVVFSLSLLFVLFSLAAQSSFEKDIQTQLIMVEDGGTVTLPAGKYQVSGSLSMDEKKNVTIKGAGMGKTVLSFKGQKTGAEGLKIMNSEAITLQDFSIEDTKGDAIKVQETVGITFLRVKTEWTGKASEKNGSYGLYPVQCENVLIDACEAIGASDAGIYVGQSHQIIVRNSRAYRNVAGIEIENSTMADVYNNVAEGNTGGILVFDLPGLIKKKGGNVRVYDNVVRSNNYKNFAPKGTSVADVPPGTGLMVLAASDVELFNNQVIDNKTVGTSIVSYLFTEREITDEEYDPYPARIYIHDNVFEKGKNGKQKPSLKSKVGLLFLAKFGRKVPNIIWDGIVKDGYADENGNLKSEFGICIKNNKNGSFANLKAAEGFKNISKDLAPFDCERATLQPADLAGGNK
jgi:parallel beta-helix repeat protein